MVCLECTVDLITLIAIYVHVYKLYPDNGNVNDHGKRKAIYIIWSYLDSSMHVLMYWSEKQSLLLLEKKHFDGTHIRFISKTTSFIEGPHSGMIKIYIHILLNDFF